MNTLRLKCSRDALVRNWHTLDRMSGTAATGAAVKADGYGLGATEVVRALSGAGCRDFYVAHWQEVGAVVDVAGEADISVLHGVSAADMDNAYIRHPRVKPVLNSIAQVRRWQHAGGGRCDVMFDTGMNRLGMSLEDIDNIGPLDIDVCMSHLASADQDSTQNSDQLFVLRDIRQRVKARRYSLANSAGIALGKDYHFDLTRPGIALYGGIQRPEFTGAIKSVVQPEAMILQTRDLRKNDKVGYNATFTARHDMRVAILSLGYADGYLRAFSNCGAALYDSKLNDSKLKDSKKLAVLGRVSMDLIAIDISRLPDLGEGDWLKIVYDLRDNSEMTGLSQYELLTGLGTRFERLWE